MQLPRYSSRDFPAYRYVPGRNPHPVIDPSGHSYQRATSSLSFCVPQDWQKNDAYLYGVDLFNHGYWWEAHESWEQLWLTTDKQDTCGLYLQGLIQFAAALLKLYAGSRGGFDSLCGEALKKFCFCLAKDRGAAAHRWMGLPFEAWVQRVLAFEEALKTQSETPVDALQRPDYPFLILEVP